MEWTDHDQWANRFGVSKQVSKDVNTIIDAVEQGEKIPPEYRRGLEKCAQDWTEENAPNGKSAMDMVISDYSAREHDVSRSSKTGGDIAADVHLCAMREMGDDYVKAWYLHHHLDFLAENWNKESIFDILTNNYQESHPMTYSSEVESFLREHIEDLVNDLERQK